AVPGADDGGDRQGQGHGDGDVLHRGLVPVEEELAGDGRADGVDRADRQVDALGGDDEGHAERDEQQRGAAAQDVDERAAEPAVVDLGDDEAEAGDDDVDDEERGEHDERPHEPLEVGVRLPFARCVERLDHSALPRVTIVSTMRSVVMSDSSWRTSMSSRSRRTAIRSDRRVTSSSSAEMNRTDMPSSESSATRRWMSAFAPTSMPRVGSSRMSRRGSMRSQRARRTFCWLPPERFLTGRSGLAGRMSSLAMNWATSSARRAGGTALAQPREACIARIKIGRAHV